MNLIATIEKKFYDDETEEEKDKKSFQLFGVPSPNFLNVTLSPDSCKKIKYLYILMSENNLTKIEFFIKTPSLRRGDFPPKPNEINLFLPMKNQNIIFKQEYLDFGEVFFDVFETQCSRIELDSFENKIKFQFIYFNGWTEEVFIFTYPLKEFVNKL